MRPFRRGGFTLLEVLMATAVLLGSLLVLLQMAYVGKRHARDAETYATAQLICQTRLNEMLAGARPLAAVEKEYLYELPGWVLVVEVNPLEKSGLAEVRVIVREDASATQMPSATPISVAGDLSASGELSVAGQLPLGSEAAAPVGGLNSIDEESARQFMLVHWVPDPLGVAGGARSGASYGSEAPLGTGTPFGEGEPAGLFRPSEFADPFGTAAPPGFSDPFGSAGPLFTDLP